MVVDNSLLLSLAEVCVAFTGFIGIVVVLGRRSQGEWTEVENTRFWTLITSSITAIALTLLPILFGLRSIALIGLIVGGTTSFVIGRNAYKAIWLPTANRLLGVVIVTLTALVYGAFVLCVAGVVPITIDQYYLALILWYLSISILFFVRLLRAQQS